MKIGFDASRAFTAKKTGTENYSYQILKHLAQIDHKNQYYIYLASQHDGLRNWPANFKFVPISNHLLWTQIGLAGQIFKDPVDLLFVPAHTLPIIRRGNIKTTVTVHDLGAQYLPQTHQLKQRLYLNFMTHYQLRSATCIIAVSQATKADLVEKVGIDPRKITVIYEGYNQSLFKPMPSIKQEKVLAKYNLKPGGYFLFVGTIQPRKNLTRLIQAFADYLKTSSKHERLVLIGSKGWLSEEIYTLPKQLQLQDKVFFLGYVGDEKLPHFYSGAKAFLFPSLFEGFGLPILEAMACGCPVLTSNISSMPEVADNAAILVDPYSVDSILKGIQDITEFQTKDKLIKKGFEQIKKFNWKIAANQTLAVLTNTSQQQV